MSSSFTRKPNIINSLCFNIKCSVFAPNTTTHRTSHICLRKNLSEVLDLRLKMMMPVRRLMSAVIQFCRFYADLVLMTVSW